MGDHDEREALARVDGWQQSQPWPDPTPEMLESPMFEAIWQAIKTWDISVPGAYAGRCGATGNHVRAIMEAAGWRRSPQPAEIRALVDRFLAWPLPASVASDRCVTDAAYPFARSGTNLLTADEARQMFEYLLGGDR